MRNAKAVLSEAALVAAVGLVFALAANALSPRGLRLSRNYYHAEQYLPAVLPMCLNAQKVVVYCAGGTCEESEFAAVMLRDAGVPLENLFVYVGGISEWTAQGQKSQADFLQSAWP